MKYLSLTAFVAMLDMTTAFSPQAHPPRQSELKMIDPDTVHHLARHAADAYHVVMLDCEDEECSLVDGLKEEDGWHFEDKIGGGGYETAVPGHNSRILMMELDDTE